MLRGTQFNESNEESYGIPHHLGSGLLSRHVICRYRNEFLLLFLKFSVLVANPKKLLYTVANPARGLLDYAGLGPSRVCTRISSTRRLVNGFQLLVDSGSSTHFIDPELIRGVESRILNIQG